MKSQTRQSLRAITLTGLTMIPAIPAKVADWLKLSVVEKNRIHLLGNHELFYVSGNDMMKCSGNTQTNFQTIKMRKIP
jgi:hypothetical protein